MSFGEHLEELRKVFIKCLISIAIGCVFGFLLANKVVNLLTGPLVRGLNKYNQITAIEELEKRNGFVDPELLPWMQQESLVPRRQYIDPTALVSALQTVIPNFAGQVNADPYRIAPSQFVNEKLTQLCQQLSNSESAADDGAQRRQRIWALLKPDEQLTVRRIAQQTTTTEADKEVIAEILNRISKESRLFELEEFQAEVADPESSWWSFLIPPAPNLLARLKEHIESTNDSQLIPRLNRTLLARLFAEEMMEMRLNLVPVTTWERLDAQPQSLGVTETFMVWLKAGILTGFTFAAPIVFYHLWTFVAAGLYPHEQKYVHIYLPISIGLFVCGVLLAFVFVFDPVLDFLFSFNRQMGIVPQMRISDWLSFVMFLPLGFGTAFQLPLVMLFLNRIGLVQVADYIAKWRIAIMIIFVVSMFLTPQDPLSLLLMAIPLSFLYAVGLGMCLWMPKNKNPFEEPEREYVPV
jgi:sec-independent protein translocase protein TatC